MKNFFMALAMVAMVATSCSNDDATQANISGPQKSVKFSLENVITTRGWDGMITDTTVNLKDYQVFFVGGDGTLYTAKEIDGVTEAQQYFTSTTNTTKLFHFLPASVQKVVVVGNIGQELNVTTHKAIKDAVTTAAEQQDDENLWVYGEAALESTNDPVDHGNTYKAEVSVKPLVARIEIGGFICDFSDVPLYDQVDITMVALNKYYETSTIGGTLDGYNVTSITSANAYPFFNSTDAEAYTKDEFSVTLTPSNNAFDFPTTEILAYHTFAGEIPQLVVRIKGIKDGVESPLYLATLGFNENGTAIEAFEAGNIYRMKFNGENRFAFSDEDLAQPQKCVNVSIETADWIIREVTPEF